MPTVTHKGELTRREDRYPHTKEFHCWKCKTRFRLTVEDTDKGYYTTRPKTIERGDQRETYTANVIELVIPCPECPNAITEIAPDGWTVAFAKGKE